MRPRPFLVNKKRAELMQQPDTNHRTNNLPYQNCPVLFSDVIYYVYANLVE